jgi:hypothetical protein
MGKPFDPEKYNKTEKAHFIGILQEKKENLLRITKESILNLKGRLKVQ